MVSRYEQLMRRVESDEPLSHVLSSALRLSQDVGGGGQSLWIEREMLGYVAGTPSMTDKIVVPEYRTVSGQWFDAFGRPFLITQPSLAFINEARLRFGVAELQQFATVRGDLGLPLPEFAEIIKQNLQVDVYWFRFSPTAIPPILASIRSQLVRRLVSSRSQFEQIQASRVTNFEEEIIELRPNLYGIGINVRALWRRWHSTPEEE